MEKIWVRFGFGSYIFSFEFGSVLYEFDCSVLNLTVPQLSQNRSMLFVN